MHNVVLLVLFVRLFKEAESKFTNIPAHFDTVCVRLFSDELFWPFQKGVVHFDFDLIIRKRFDMLRLAVIKIYSEARKDYKLQVFPPHNIIQHSVI